MSLDRYQLGEILCSAWSQEMAERFPNAKHTGCRQAPTNSMGHHDCPDRPQ